VVLVATITFAVALSAGGAGIVPPNHPRANLTAVPKYSIVSGKSYVVGRALPPCWTWSTSHQLIPRSTTALCVKDEIAATNRAQSSEHLGPMTLPSNFASLSAPEQLLVTVDLERVSRGETPVAGVSASLDALAQSAAVARQDPSLPSASSYPGATGGYVANWAGALSALDANYDWMYLDGWAGSATFNYDCTSAQAAGCWGHRDNILVNGSRMPCLVASCSLVMGGGYVYLGAGQDFSSFSELIVQVNGAPSDLYYSWATAVADGAKP
jgi:hypothetical protein